MGRALGRHNNVEEYDSRASMVLDYLQVRDEIRNFVWPVPDFNTNDIPIVLQTFWNEEEGFMTETTITDVKKGRSGYGSAPLTASVYNFDPSLGCDDATFQPCSPRALSSLKVVGDRFKAFFPLSQNFTERQPPYFGFFTEDEFIGGHVSPSDVRRINTPTYNVS